MRQPPDPATSRRMFLKFLASSPVLASAGLSLGVLDQLLASGPDGAPDLERLMGHYPQQDEVIASETDALSVFDFHAVAKKVLPPAHYGYLSTSVDDDSMLRVNREGFTKFQLRMRRLIDVSTIDMSTELLGTSWETPIFLCPVAGHMAYNREGEIAVARAARAKGHLQMLSNETSTAVEDVNAARGEPVWFQLYASNEWEGTAAKVKWAEAAGCPALVFTVDLQGGRNTETDQRMKRLDDRQCDLCHDPDRPKPMYEGIARSRWDRPEDMTWDYLTRLKELTTMKVLVKGARTPSSASRTAPMRSSCRTTAAALNPAAGRASSACRKSPTSSAAAFQSSIAASAAALTCSRPSRSARPPSVSGGPIFGAWRHSVRPASRPCWRFCAASSRSSCARLARHRSPGSHAHRSLTTLVDIGGTGTP